VGVVGLVGDRQSDVDAALIIGAVTMKTSKRTSTTSTSGVMLISPMAVSEARPRMRRYVAPACRPRPHRAECIDT